MSEPNSVNSAMDGMPGWMRALMLFGNTFGLPALILGFYLAQDAGVIGNPTTKELQELKGLVIQHEASMRELTKAVETQASHLAESAKERRMRCVLRATTEDEKKACF